MAKHQDEEETGGTTVLEVAESNPVNRRYSTLAERIENEEEYLTSNGWEITGDYDYTGKHFWHDPEGAGPKTATPGPIIRLPQRGGGFETHQQMQVPPAAWRHPHDKAVAIQQVRDKSKGKHISLQDRHNRLGKVLDETNHEIQLLFSEIDRLVKRQIPEKPDNIHAELMNTKRTLFAALAGCREKLTKIATPQEVTEE